MTCSWWGDCFAPCVRSQWRMGKRRLPRKYNLLTLSVFPPATADSHNDVTKTSLPEFFWTGARSPRGRRGSLISWMLLHLRRLPRPFTLLPSSGWPRNDVFLMIRLLRSLRPLAMTYGKEEFDAASHSTNVEWLAYQWRVRRMRLLRSFFTRRKGWKWRIRLKRNYLTSLFKTIPSGVEFLKFLKIQSKFSSNSGFWK